MSSKHKSLSAMYNINNKTPEQRPDQASTREGTSPDNTSLNEIKNNTIRIELPVEEYAVLAKRAAQEGVSAEVLVAQAVGKLLQ